MKSHQLTVKPASFRHDLTTSNLTAVSECLIRDSKHRRKTNAYGAARIEDTED